MLELNLQDIEPIRILQETEQYIRAAGLDSAADEFRDEFMSLHPYTADRVRTLVRVYVPDFTETA